MSTLAWVLGIHASELTPEQQGLYPLSRLPRSSSHFVTVISSVGALLFRLFFNMSKFHTSSLLQCFLVIFNTLEHTTFIAPLLCLVFGQLSCFLSLRVSSDSVYS